MNEVQIYFLILLTSLFTAFVPWILMQMYFDWEIFWGRISVVGFISTIVTILVGIFYLVNWFAELF